MNKAWNVTGVVGVYLAISILAVLLYPLVPRWFALVVMFGPNIGLFTDLSLALILATVFTLSLFIGYAITGSKGLLVCGIGMWLMWGALFAYTVTP